MAYPNPLAETATADAEDLDLVRLVQSGSTGALELLIGRHQRWIYSIALRMVFHPEDAEDATQEILLKLVTKVAQAGTEPARRRHVVLALPVELEGKLAAAASRRGVSVEALAREAVEHAMEYDDWFLRKVETVLAQVEAGQTLTHEVVGMRLVRELADHDDAR